MTKTKMIKWLKFITVFGLVTVFIALTISIIVCMLMPNVTGKQGICIGIIVSVFGFLNVKLYLHNVETIAKLEFDNIYSEYKEEYEKLKSRGIPDAYINRAELFDAIRKIHMSEKKE